MDYTVLATAPIVLFPFLAFVINALFGRYFKSWIDKISCASIVLSFFWAVNIFMDFMNVYNTDYYIHKYFTWFDLSHGSSSFKMDLGIYIDNMTAMMLLMVTGAASLIHIFSTWYMKGDARYERFFIYLSLFTTGMLGMVMADNLLLMFIFWELMGFCSYSLIGFYYEKEKAGNASIKAFMTTRVGDVIFLLGILAIWSTIGSVNLPDIYSAVAQDKFAGLKIFEGTWLGMNFAGISLLAFTAFCIFCGTIGKSAQFPLQVWLPDAMMGPTPCSALIHAATMVAAGVYLSLRTFPIMEAGGMLPFIAYTGAITAFMAASIALVQTDFKAVLAFSTISQLGYMVLGIGVGAYNPAFMHLITHAVFKACLFLSAGSVIHAIHVQEMPRMGGLWKKLKLTHFAMLCCTLAIAGVPFFSGFVSKDRILGDALYWAMDNKQHLLVPVLGFITAGMTAFYMFRMMILAFYGEPRDKEIYDHCKEEKLSFNRNIPLLILAFFTLGIWFSGSLTGQGIVKVFGDRYEWFQTMIVQPKVEKFIKYEKQPYTFAKQQVVNSLDRTQYDPKHGYSDEKYEKVHTAHVQGAILSVIVAFLGIFLAFAMYWFKWINPASIVKRMPPVYNMLVAKYGMDHLYEEIVIKRGLLPFNNLLARFDLNVYDKFVIDGFSVKLNNTLKIISKKFDENVVDWLVDFIGGNMIKDFFRSGLRILQNGSIQLYFAILILFVWIYNIIL